MQRRPSIPFEAIGQESRRRKEARDYGDTLNRALETIMSQNPDPNEPAPVPTDPVEPPQPVTTPADFEDDEDLEDEVDDEDADDEE